MTLDTLPQFLAAIESLGELVRIDRPVRTHLEIAEIADRVMKSPGGGPALLFTQPVQDDGRVSPIPVAIQNAPQYIGVGLSDDALLALRRNHPNFVLLKGEGSALEIARTIEALGGEVPVFNGRGGLELPDVLRAGCAGLIPAPEAFDVLLAVHAAMARGDEAEADRIYAGILPLIVFLMQSIDQFLCYGKRLTARRLGLGEVHDRAPAQAPTALGLACMERWGQALRPFPAG